MKKIQIISRFFRRFFQLLFFTSPIAMATFWIFFESLPRRFALHHLPVDDYEIVFNVTSQVLAILVSLLPLVIFMYGMSLLIKLFRNYERGDIFASANVQYFKKLGYTLFASVFGGWLYDMLISYVLTFQNPPMSHHRMLIVMFKDSDISTMVVAGLILLIAWIMDEAEKISTENSQTI